MEREVEEPMHCGERIHRAADRQEVGDKVKRRMKDDSQISGLNNLADSYGENGGKKHSEFFHFGYVKSDV